MMASASPFAIVALVLMASVVSAQRGRTYLEESEVRRSPRATFY